jgi:YbgC/YbaW family acyl-CoA thioester hydrolase
MKFVEYGEMKKLYEFKLNKTVEFAETDMAGIMHFSNFFRYMEIAEHAFYRSLGWSVHPHESVRDVVWPRVNAQCDFKQPLYFEDEVEIHLLVQEKREKSIRYQFHINKIVNDDRINAAVGRLTIVCSKYDRETRTFKSAPLPERINKNLENAPDHLLNLNS